MPASKYASGRTEFTGWSRRHTLPISLPPAPYEGALLYANDGKLHYSDGDEWVPLLEQAIDRPAGLAPTTAIEQTQLRLSPYFSRRGLLHTATRFEVSLTEAFTPESLLFVRQIDAPVESYQITVDDGLTYGQEFFWRGIYIADAQESDPSIPLLQQYPKEIQDPTAITPSGFTADLLEVSPFETAFPTQFVYGGLNVEIYQSDSVGDIGPLLYSFTLSGADGGDGQISLAGYVLEDGERYYWRAQYQGIDFLGGGTVLSEWTTPRYFNPIPSTIVLTFDTNIGPNGKTIALPIFGDGADEPNAVVNWGDGTPTTAVTVGAWVQHEYAVHGQYTVKISGTVQRYGDGSYTAYAFSQEKLRTVTAIGDGMSLTSLQHAFAGCKNLIAAPSSIPAGITSLYATFFGCASFNADITNWDVSAVGSLYATFSGCTNFNQAIGSWDVSNVSDASFAFRGCSRFNQPLLSWDVRATISADYMFDGCAEFNQSLAAWQPSGLSTAVGMFRGCVKLNQPFDAWGAYAVGLTNTRLMFQQCERLNQPFTSWDMSTVTDTGFMFERCFAFNGDVTTWDVGNVLAMDYMFAQCSAFNQDISGWNVSNVRNFTFMFYLASAFDQNIGGWSMANATTLVGMFRDAGAFNQDISGWVTSSVGAMDAMFRGAASFNQPIGTWDVSAVGTTGALTGGMARMFYQARSFDQSLSLWDVSNVYSMTNMFAFATNVNSVNTIGVENWLVTGHRCVDTSWMFQYCPSFDADLGAWDMATVTTTRGMFRGATTFTNGGTDTIGAWNMANVTQIGYMFAETSLFNADISAWDVSSVWDFLHVFNNAKAFNQPIGAWAPGAALAPTDPIDTANMFWSATAFNQDVSGWFNAPNGLRNMAGMFRGATVFNNGEVAGASTAPMTGWNVGSAATMHYMFAGARAFNQPINTWDVSSVARFDYMFLEADVFNQDISAWVVSAGWDFTGMFQGANVFNADISGWDVSSGQLFSDMFLSAVAFNRNISGWNLGSAVSTAGMFRNAELFNQPVGAWNMSNVIDTSRMFFDAKVFDQSLAGWDISKIDLMEDMMSGSTVADYPPWSTANYSATLVAWVASNPRSGVPFHAGDATYDAAAATARQTLIDTYGWAITDGGLA